MASMFILCLSSCGTTTKVAANISKFETPSAQQADSIFASIVAPTDKYLTFVTGEGENSKIYGFVPSSDSSEVKVVSLVPLKREWTLESLVNYTDGDESAMPLKILYNLSHEVVDSVEFYSYSTLREKDGKVQKSIAVYRTDTDDFQYVCFTGKRLSDNRIEGESNEAMLQNLDKTHLKWAVEKLHTDEELVFLSKADLMTDQAIEWWLQKNPKAQSNATKISFGQLDPECSLVQAYQSATKENASSYRAALFDIRGYTVVVSFKKSTGTYSLTWAEPVCKNKKTDRLLNSIYFSNGSNLNMFYYKGNTTFKYILNLANGSISRR